MHLPLSPLEGKAGLLGFCCPRPLTPHLPSSTLSSIPSPTPSPFAPAQNRSSARDRGKPNSKSRRATEPCAPRSSAPRRRGQEAAASLRPNFPFRARTMAFGPENEVRRRPRAPWGPSGIRRATPQVRRREVPPSSPRRTTPGPGNPRIRTAPQFNPGPSAVTPAPGARPSPP